MEEYWSNDDTEPKRRSQSSGISQVGITPIESQLPPPKNYMYPKLPPPSLPQVSIKKNLQGQHPPERPPPPSEDPPRETLTSTKQIKKLPFDNNREKVDIDDKPPPVPPKSFRLYTQKND